MLLSRSPRAPVLFIILTFALCIAIITISVITNRNSQLVKVKDNVVQKVQEKITEQNRLIEDEEENDDDDDDDDDAEADADRSTSLPSQVQIKDYTRKYPNNMNYFISNTNYSHRLKPDYYKVKEEDFWQMDTYLLSGEIARRYRAKYIIDVGCGRAAKLSKFGDEFRLIGVDYGVNLLNAKNEYPYIQTYEANMDRSGTCSLHIPVEIVMQSVVLSADVIEHIVDVHYCYLKILKELAEHAMAVLVSTPERTNSKGPPNNPAHVREWTREELDVLFLENNLHVITSSWICASTATKKCNVLQFLPERNPFNTHLHLIGNTQVRVKWLYGPVNLDTKVVAILIIHPETCQNLVNFNIAYLRQQNVEVVIINMDTEIMVPDHEEIGVHEAEHFHDVIPIIESLVYDGDYKNGDWFMIVDAHEIISFPPNPEFDLNLRDVFLRIDQEPYGMNAIGMSYYFMEDLKGKAFSDDIPFKIYSPEPWNDATYRNFSVSVNTMGNRVKIWKKTDYSIQFLKQTTQLDYDIITDVMFTGRYVYPYFMQSLRFHPKICERKPTTLNNKVQSMYNYESVLGFVSFFRTTLTENSFMY